MKVKKAQAGAKKKAAVDSVDSEMFPGKKVAIKDIRRGPYISKNKPTVKKKMKDGGSLKPVDSSKNPGLAKLPTPVRNKMGYQKDGGKLKKAKSGATLSPSTSSVSSKLGGYKNVIGKNYSGKAKSGASVKKAMGGMKMMKGGGKCKYGC